ncbi:MAG: ankyrin repeat domain-containing protein [Hyphomicrobium sp.]
MVKVVLPCSNRTQAHPPADPSLKRNDFTGWQQSFAITDQEECARVRAELAAIAQRLLAAGVDVNDMRGQRTPLTAAALGNQWEAFAFLHDKGALIDAHDRSGDTPLTAAAFSGALDVCEYLVAAGANRGLRTEVPAYARDPNFAEFDIAEGCPFGSRALECAALAKAMLPDGDPRRAIFERVEAIVR